MKIKKLSNQFLLNYILIILLILAIGSLGYYMYVSYNRSLDDFYGIDIDLFLEDYARDGLSHALSTQAFQEGDYVLTLTPDREIIETTTDQYEIGYRFDEIELQELLYGEDYYSYIVFYNEDYSKLFVMYTVYVDYGYAHITTIFGLAIVLFILLAIGFANYTSNQILRPILKLVNGVQKIGHGDYTTQIEFDASNELNILKTEINLMAEKIQLETEKRQETEEKRKQLIRDISHDVRTPLTNILGYSNQLIQKNDFTSDSQKQSIEIIHQYGTAANHLISELFDLSRLEINEDSFERKETDISEWLRLKLIDYINEFEQKNIAYDFQIPDQAILVAINDLYLQRLVDNLLINAMKYNETDLSIYVELKEEEDHYKLIIADNGIGIPKELHQKIFDPLVRVETSRNRSLGGTGLGLSIVKQVVDKHGWTIELLSGHEGVFFRGCTFEICMPR